METEKESLQVTDFESKFLFSLSQLSNEFGPARETITKRLRAAGVRHHSMRAGHPVYRVGDAARAILAEELAFQSICDPDELPPKDRLDYYRGSTEKRKQEVDEGRLIPADEHSQGMAEVVKILVRTLDTIPDVLEMKCKLSPSALIEIEGHCDAARVQLATELEG
ncbi:MAG: DUF1441 family protein [Thiotrichales bacterium]|nr:DUF1441 family protein [Thiotrichales bacterium]